MAVQRIANVDAYEAIKRIKDKSVDLIITDPPYELKDLSPNQPKNPNSIARSIKFVGEILDNNLDVGLKDEILEEYMRVMKIPNIYIFCNKSMIIKLLDFFVKKNNCNFEILLFAKENPIPFCSSHYLVDKEYCLYFWKQGATLKIPYERGKTIYLQKINIEDKNNFGHPTIKPLNMIENLILNSSKEEDLILDTFVGNGTTALACKHLNRNFIGYEINKKYFEIACDRLKGINIRGELNLFDMDL